MMTVESEPAEGLKIRGGRASSNAVGIISPPSVEIGCSDMGKEQMPPCPTVPLALGIIMSLASGTNPSLFLCLQLSSLSLSQLAQSSLISSLIFPNNRPKNIAVFNYILIVLEK